MMTSQRARCKSRKVAERDVETNVSGDTNDRWCWGGGWQEGVIYQVHAYLPRKRISELQSEEGAAFF